MSHMSGTSDTQIKCHALTVKESTFHPQPAVSRCTISFMLHAAKLIPPPGIQSSMVYMLYALSQSVKKMILYADIYSQALWCTCSFTKCMSEARAAVAWRLHIVMLCNIAYCKATLQLPIQWDVFHGSRCVCFPS